MDTENRDTENRVEEAFERLKDAINFEGLRLNNNREARALYQKLIVVLKERLTNVL